MYRCLGFDPSLVSSGFAFRDVEFKPHTGLIKPNKLRDSARLSFIKDSFTRIMLDASDGMDGHVPVIAYEGYAMGRRPNISRQFSTGELGGVLKLLAWGAGVDVLLVPPSSLKLFAAGYGNADKGDIIKAVAEKHGYSIKQHDEADAFMLMLLGEAFLSKRNRAGHVRRAIAGCQLIEGNKVCS